jgi:hypothetical protein
MIAGNVEEQLFLPFQPSPYVLKFLFAICCEIHRAGGHTIRRVVLEYLARELTHAVLDLYYRVAQAHHGGGSSKEGGLQLLCDAYFLINMLNAPTTTMPSDEDLHRIVMTMPRAPHHLGDGTNFVCDAVDNATPSRTEERVHTHMA